MFNQSILEKIADFIKEKLPSGGIICITGCGRSGKTTLTNRLLLTLGEDKAGRYPFDCLHTPISYRRNLMEKKDIVVTGPHPDTVIKEMGWKTVKSIKSGEDTPVYASEFIDDNVKYNTIGLYKNKKYNIVDGITAMHHSLGQFYDMVIFLECSSEVELQRRLFKEGYEMNQSSEEIRNVFPIRRKQYEEHILLYKKDANIIVDTTEGDKPIVTFVNKL